MLPRLSGRAVQVQIRPTLGEHHASTFIRRRLILLDSEVLSRRGEFERILVHEIFHFAWVRLANSVRRDWEDVLRSELAQRARGELGWSAERRKSALSKSDPKLRSIAWRLYACESFCDTAAWAFAGLTNHDEFTLAPRHRRVRRMWFEDRFAGRPLMI